MTPRQCNECEHHEALAERTNTMWGGGQILLWVLLFVLSALGAGVSYAIQENVKTKEHVSSLQSLVAEGNLNLKHFMRAQGVEYLETSKGTGN